MRARGNCYAAAGAFLLDAGVAGRAEGVTLVHGRPVLQVEPFCQYGHAWVEFTEVLGELGGRTVAVELCRDCESGVTLPRQLYYHLGRIAEEDCFRYTIDDLRRWVLETGHWGPWEGPEACGPSDNAQETDAKKVKKN